MRRVLGSVVLVGLAILPLADAGARPWHTPGAEPAPDEPAPQLKRRFDYGALEIAVLAEVNLMRRDPAAYAERMRATRAWYRGNLIMRPGQVAVQTEEGVRALDEAIDAVAAVRRLPRLAFADGLKLAARDHAHDLGHANMTGHNGSDGSTPDRRIARHGTWDVSMAENITFGPSTAEDIVMGLLIDDGVADRGHRETLLSNDLFFAGVGCGPHPGYRVVCVIDFATAFHSKREPGREPLQQHASEPPAPVVAPSDDANDDANAQVPEDPNGDPSEEPNADPDAAPEPDADPSTPPEPVTPEQGAHCPFG